MGVALGGLFRPFCILHSAFILRMSVAWRADLERDWLEFDCGGRMGNPKAGNRNSKEGRNPRSEPGTAPAASQPLGKRCFREPTARIAAKKRKRHSAAKRQRRSQTSLNAEAQRDAEKRREKDLSEALCESLRLCVKSFTAREQIGI
jgi:hypothetical protein